MRYDGLMNEEEAHTIVSTASLFSTYKLVQTKKKLTERGELLSYFSHKLGQPIPRFVWRLKGLKLPDLYFIKSDCDQASARGVAWGAAFHHSLQVPSK